MIKFKTAYDFYNLPDEERIKYIGVPFEEEGIKVKNVFYKDDGIFFPIGLNNIWENYGKTPGLLYISTPYQLKNKSYWFKVGAFSPDDLDIDLEFIFQDQKSCHNKRKLIIKWLLSNPYGEWTDTSYREVIGLIKENFGGNDELQ